jgi:hypothetical protein
MTTDGVGRRTALEMASAVERILGFAEGAVGVVERVLGVTSPSGETFQLREACRQRAAGGFDVLEVVEPTGGVSWVVSNGHDSATCNSAEFAERVRVSLG